VAAAAQDLSAVYTADAGLRGTLGLEAGVARSQAGDMVAPETWPDDRLDLGIHRSAYP